MLTETAVTDNVGPHADEMPPPEARSYAATDHSLAGAFARLGQPVRYERNAGIYSEEAPARYFYQVATGAVRTYNILEDGRRQIAAFHLPGDVFGLEASEYHRFSAEAVVDSTVRVARRAAIMLTARHDSELAADLWARTAGNLCAAHKHMLLLGRKNAEERVATFLLDMAAREAGGDHIQLPMSRQDIADYLGLTIETVSRTFTGLEAQDAIALPTCRRVVLRSRASLQRLDA